MSQSLNLYLLVKPTSRRRGPLRAIHFKLPPSLIYQIIPICRSLQAHVVFRTLFKDALRRRQQRPGVETMTSSSAAGDNRRLSALCFRLWSCGRNTKTQLSMGRRCRVAPQHGRETPTVRGIKNASHLFPFTRAYRVHTDGAH